MKRHDPDFPDKLKGVDFETLENNQHSIYAISKKLDFIYFNLGYFNFAKQNGVDEIILDRFPIGSAITKAISGKKLQDFYLKNYSKTLKSGKVWLHEYECSSADEYRLYHQITYPLKDREILIVSNQLMVNLPIAETNKKAYEAAPKKYIQASGLITQCSNCRCVQRSDNSNIWDWIPAWIKKMPEKTSHSICSTCFDYYWKYSNLKYTKD